MKIEVRNVGYSSRSGQFFQIEPVAGETIAMDGKVLRGSYNRSTNASTTASHPAIQLVTVAKEGEESPN